MAYIGTSPSNGVRRRFVYVATSNQTSFSGNDENGISLVYVDVAYLDVYQNGVKLKSVDDYASTTGTSVVLVQGASADDVVEIIAYDVFSVGDTVSAKDGGSFGGNIASPIVTASTILASTSVKTPLIEFTDGDDAIAIADGGVVTLLTTAVAKSEGGAVTTNIAQGLCKTWWFVTGTSTAVITDSLNTSGITDVGTGDYTIAIANNMGNATYSIGGMAGVASSTDVTSINIQPFAGAIAAGSLRYNTTKNNANEDGDQDSLNYIQLFGDLA